MIQRNFYHLIVLACLSVSLASAQQPEYSTVALTPDFTTLEVNPKGPLAAQLNEAETQGEPIKTLFFAAADKSTLNLLYTGNDDGTIDPKKAMFVGRSPLTYERVLKSAPKVNETEVLDTLGRTKNLYIYGILPKKFKVDSAVVAKDIELVGDDKKTARIYINVNFILPDDKRYRAQQIPDQKVLSVEIKPTAAIDTEKITKWEVLVNTNLKAEEAPDKFKKVRFVFAQDKLWQHLAWSQTTVAGSLTRSLLCSVGQPGEVYTE